MNEIKITYNGVSCWIFANGYGVESDFCIPLTEIARCDPSDIWEAMTWATENRVVLDRILFLSCNDVDFEGMHQIVKEYDGAFVGRIAQNKLNQAIEYRNWLDSRKKTKKPSKKNGFVYLAYAETGQYKIGKSKGPEGRIKTMDTKMPISIDLVHSFPADNYSVAEASLHGEYAHKHHEGEWFNLDERDVQIICEIISYEDGQFIR